MTNGDRGPGGLGGDRFGRGARRLAALAAALGIAALYYSGAGGLSPFVQAFPRDGSVLRSDRPLSIPLPTGPDEAQEVTVWLRFPDRVDRTGALPVRIVQGDRTVVAKTLHNADPGLFVVLRPSPETPYQLSVG